MNVKSLEKNCNIIRRSHASPLFMDTWTGLPEQPKHAGMPSQHRQIINDG